MWKKIKKVVKNIPKILDWIADVFEAARRIEQAATPDPYNNYNR